MKPPSIKRPGSDEPFISAARACFVFGLRFLGFITPLEGDATLTESSARRRAKPPQSESQNVARPRMLTPSGRFEINKRICLSMSDFHKECEPQIFEAWISSDRQDERIEK